ncbi:serine hydrolase domain-containing protein [Bacteroidota bacterium]
MKKSKFFNKQVIITLLLFMCAIASFGQGQFPSKTWDKINRPEDLGYSTARLEKAKEYSKTIQTAAVMIVIDGVVLYQWGDVEAKLLTHSTRKSFLSALYGKYVKEGLIDLDKTLAELGIDDDPPLSEQEKKATIRDCMKARSCVFHTAEAESPGMHDLKPERGSLQAGTFWLYNNWDFNVLYTIFQQLTGKEMFDALKEDIADPIQMEDFLVSDKQVFTTGRSIHPAYMFTISARDMARFGLLFLRQGNWNGKQIIPKEWVKESTSYCSDATVYRRDGYGYMWWAAKDFNRYPHFRNVTLPEGTYSARGAGGQYIIVIPKYNMVFVHRVNTFEGKNVAEGDVGRLLQLILNSKIPTINNN